MRIRAAAAIRRLRRRPSPRRHRCVNRFALFAHRRHHCAQRIVIEPIVKRQIRISRMFDRRQRLKQFVHPRLFAIIQAPGRPGGRLPQIAATDFADVMDLRIDHRRESSHQRPATSGSTCERPQSRRLPAIPSSGEGCKRSTPVQSARR